MKILFKLRTSSIITFEAFLGHALFALCYEIHFYLEASRGREVRNRATEKCRQKLYYKASFKAEWGLPVLSMTKAFG